MILEATEIEVFVLILGQFALLHFLFRQSCMVAFEIDASLSRSRGVLLDCLKLMSVDLLEHFLLAGDPPDGAHIETFQEDLVGVGSECLPQVLTPHGGRGGKEAEAGIAHSGHVARLSHLQLIHLQ